jgi:putative tryptophan/tyrosine transport system substrate-binding protein
MKRREFITLLGGAAVAWPLVAGARQSAMPVIGYLSATSAGDDTRLTALRAGLEEQGFVEGRNVAIEYRHADGKYERLAEMASEFATRPLAVIMAHTLPAALAAKNATASNAIVFVSGADPVQLGLVKSLRQPGGNATGVSQYFGHLGGKRLELLRELVRGPGLFAYLLNPKNQNAEAHSAEVRDAARAMAQPIEVLTASNEREIEAAFDTMVQRKAIALLIGDDPFYSAQNDLLIALAARNALAAMHYRIEYVAAGGLVSYGSSEAETYRQAGIYTGRILKGERPADLPVVQPVKFELAINLKTAKALGLTVPPSMLARADEVIE